MIRRKTLRPGAANPKAILSTRTFHHRAQRHREVEAVGIGLRKHRKLRRRTTDFAD
jgi:hypothetical protein